MDAAILDEEEPRSGREYCLYTQTEKLDFHNENEGIGEVEATTGFYMYHLKPGDS